MSDPAYPGPHPGTGYNDHGPHLWKRYRGGIVACEICGKRKEAPHGS